MVYSNFEQLPVWQASRKFIRQIYSLSTQDFKNDFSLIQQMRRAAVSINLNIAEGFERKNNKNFARFITISKESAGECRAALYIAHDLGYIDEEALNELLALINEISGQLQKFSEYLLSTSVRK